MENMEMLIKILLLKELKPAFVNRRREIESYCKGIDNSDKEPGSGKRRYGKNETYQSLRKQCLILLFKIQEVEMEIYGSVFFGYDYKTYFGFDKDGNLSTAENNLKTDTLGQKVSQQLRA